MKIWGAVFIVGLILFGVGAFGNLGNGGGGGGGGTCGTSTLTATQSFGRLIGPEPDGSYIVSLGVSVSGGCTPYNFAMLWSDGVADQNGNGIFTRTFPATPTVTSGNITISTSDNQHATVNVKVIPDLSILGGAGSFTTISMALGIVMIALSLILSKGRPF